MSKFESFTRHTKRADGISGRGLQSGEEVSEGYPSITKEGEEKAREVARKEYKEMIEKLSSNGIIFLGGSSEEGRTKDTAEIIGLELKDMYEKDESVVILDRKDIEPLGKKVQKDEKSYEEIFKDIADSNSGKKIVIVYPLFLKELSLRPDFRDKKTGEHTEFSREILKDIGQDQKAAARRWIESNGEVVNEKGKTIKIKNLEEIVKSQLESFKRLKKFAKRFSGEREVSVGIVGHGWKLDALAIYLANRGKITPEAFKKLFSGKPIDQAETGKVELGDDMKFSFRGKEYEIAPAMLE